MKKVIFKRLEIKNFKATNSRIIESIPDGGLVVTGHNGSGKSSILEAIVFALGGSIDAGKVLNQKTKAAVSVSLTIQHQDGTDTFTRVLTPTLNEAGKVTASTSSYTISGHPKKQTEYQTAVAQLFGTRDWMYLLRPELNAGNKDARNSLLAAAGAPSESEFLTQHNPALAQIIGTTSFSDFEAREKQAVQALGKKIDAIPGRIEENAAMLQEVPEMEDEAPIHQRIAEIRAIFKGVDQANAERADEYNKVACEAQALRNEAAQLRNKAAGIVAEANKAANKQVDEAEKLVYEWDRCRADLSRQMDQIKAEMNQARHEQATKERQLAESVANIQAIANECREIGSRTPQADGNCTLCGKWCADLQAKGIEAAISANTQELDRTKQKGRNEVARRDQLQSEIEKINAKIDGLQAMEHEVESRFNALGEAPSVPLRKVVESTEESRNLELEADNLEKQAAEIIKNNRMEVTQRNPELMDELQQLNEKLTRGIAITQARKNNDKIQQRIEELHEEEKQLRLTQLKHQQNIAQLKEFYRNYAAEVTGMVNDLFAGTPYTIKLFDANMSNEKGVPVMQPMVNDSNNLSTAENLLFWIKFVERVLSVKFGIRAPFLVDNAECVSDETQFGSYHQKFIAAVGREELTIWPLDIPKPTNAK